LNLDYHSEELSVYCIAGEPPAPGVSRLAVPCDLSVEDDMLNVENVDASFFHPFLCVVPESDPSLLPEPPDGVKDSTIVSRFHEGKKVFGVRLLRRARFDNMSIAPRRQGGAGAGWGAGHRAGNRGESG